MTEKPSYEELVLQQRIRESADVERKISNDSYATKMVERIVYGIVYVIGIGFLGFMGTLVVSAIKAGYPH